METEQKYEDRWARMRKRYGRGPCSPEIDELDVDVEIRPSEVRINHKRAIKLTEAKPSTHIQKPEIIPKQIPSEPAKLRFMYAGIAISFMKNKYNN